MSNAVQVAKIVEAALAGDTQKVLNYAALIATHFDQEGDARAARIVRRSYGAEPAGNPVCLDAPPVVVDASDATTNQRKGSVAREASSSLWDNPNPWLATCGVCLTVEDLGKGVLILPDQLTEKGWVNTGRFGYVCPGCQKIMKQPILTTNT
ncbi:hypothetical protein [Hymenobacter fodinae]|uniref:Uncharacterized protein n=1 Tax=Hymenobacter fodinae TaxID=2510796 RepID=A0A4Z0P346_9BACT|nr:hypothetical protein [Hymenobacter fodinae]TGE05539.1 hypothetical protein EU556_19760 [Hymenobacter fodinae]